MTYETPEDMWNWLRTFQSYDSFPRAWAELLLAENERLRQEIQALRAQQAAQAAFTMMEEEGEVPR